MLGGHRPWSRVSDAATRPARWFVLLDGEQSGPFPLEEVRSAVLDGRVRPGTWVWADGMAEWRQARDVPALVPPADRREDLSGWPEPPGAQ